MWPPRAFTTLLLLAAMSSASCRETPRRDQAVAGLVGAVVLPGYTRLVTAARALGEAARTLAKAPDPRALVAAQTAWRTVLVALKQTYAFRNGPIADRSLHIRAAYWPIRPSAIEALAAAPSLGAITIQEAGAASKGLFALEYLLFEPEGSDQARILAGSAASGRRAL